MPLGFFLHFFLISNELTHQLCHGNINDDSVIDKHTEIMLPTTGDLSSMINTLQGEGETFGKRVCIFVCMRVFCVHVVLYVNEL